MSRGSPEGSEGVPAPGGIESERRSVEVPVKEVTIPEILLSTGEPLRILDVPICGATCVDGRTSNGVIEIGRPAIYGGSWGALMAALAVAMEMNPNLAERLQEEETQEGFIEFLREKHRKYGIGFYIHTDKHAQQQAQKGVGCGHTQAQLSSASLRREHADAISSLYHRLLNVATDVTSLRPDYNNGAIVKEVLVGDHAERAVLVNEVPRRTYDRARGTRFVRDPWAEKPVIAFEAAIAYWWLYENDFLQGVKFKEFLEEVIKKYDAQVEVTNRELGVDHLPTINIPPQRS